MSDEAPARRTRRTRPRDRRQQIAAAARDLFATQGFDDTRIDDIADRVGITSRALYRHFDSKQVLLAHIILASQARLIAELGAPYEDLDQLLRGIADASLSNPHLSILWQREARHLAPDDFETVRANLIGMVGTLQDAIRSAQPHLDDDTLRVRAWGLIAVLSSPGHHTIGLSRPHLDDMLIAACHALLDSPPPPGSRRPVPTRQVASPSRREKLLLAAAREFRRSGYPTTSINTIGEHAGIAGPAIYRYFDTKADILTTLVGRYLEWSEHATYQARRRADPDDPDGTFRLLTESCAELATQAPDLLSITVSEWLHLPPEARKSFGRIRDQQQRERAAWLGAARPGIPTSDARALTQISTILIEDTARAAPLMSVPDLATHLASGAVAIGLNSARPHAHRAVEPKT